MKMIIIIVTQYERYDVATHISEISCKLPTNKTEELWTQRITLSEAVRNCYGSGCLVI
jgi:hypothetical protein